MPVTSCATDRCIATIASFYTPRPRLGSSHGSSTEMGHRPTSRDVSNSIFRQTSPYCPTCKAHISDAWPGDHARDQGEHSAPSSVNLDDKLSLYTQEATVPSFKNRSSSTTWRPQGECPSSVRNLGYRESVGRASYDVGIRR